MQIIKTTNGKKAITRTFLNKNNEYLEIFTCKGYNSIFSAVFKFKKLPNSGLAEMVDCDNNRSLIHKDVKRLTEKKLKELHSKAVNFFDVHKNNEYQYTTLN